MRKSLFVLAAISMATVAYAGQVVYQDYECPRCHKTAEYKEDSAHIHHCAGGPGKEAHPDTVMTHKGSVTKDVK